MSVIPGFCICCTAYLIDEFDCSKIPNIKSDKIVSNRIMINRGIIEPENEEFTYELDVRQSLESLDRNEILQFLIKPKLKTLSENDQMRLDILSFFKLDKNTLDLTSYNSSGIEIEFVQMDPEDQYTTALRYESGSKYDYSRLDKQFKREGVSNESFENTFFDWLNQLNSVRYKRALTDIATLYTLGDISNRVYNEAKSYGNTTLNIDVDVRHHVDQKDLSASDPIVQYNGNTLTVIGSVFNKSYRNKHQLGHVMFVYQGFGAERFEYDRVENHPIIKPRDRWSYSLEMNIPPETMDYISEITLMTEVWDTF